MIVCSYCGKVNEASARRCYECGAELPVPPLPEPLPQLTNPKFVSSEALNSAFTFEDDFHRADWKFIMEWIQSHVEPVHQEEAWNEAALIWVERLRDDLGGDYFVLQSRQTVLLSDQPLGTARWLLDYSDQAAVTIKEQLADTAWSGTAAKDVVLVFSDLDDYYQYLSYHTPDGEQAGSGGVCIHSGYTHIAVPWHEELDAANVIVHELAHDCLSHLPLPLWLNEGVAVTLQKAIAPPRRAIGQSEQDAFYAAAINWRAPIMWDELAQRHFAFWSAENIQSFWAGTAFSQPGDPNELSYSLAEVFVKSLTERGDINSFRRFLDLAHQNDAGQTAALDVLGVDLGAIAGTFLGKGDWRPQRKKMVACWQDAGWKSASNPASRSTTVAQSSLTSTHHAWHALTPNAPIGLSIVPSSNSWRVPAARSDPGCLSSA